MLGEKKTLPFWRRRRPNFLALERALAAESAHEERHTDAEHAVIERKIVQHRFEASKGKIHPPA
jgi:hypothetical protein